MLCGDHKGAHRIFKIAFATFSVIGLVGSLMLFFGAHIISNYWLQIQEAEMTLVALSPAIFFVAISSVMRGYLGDPVDTKITLRKHYDGLTWLHTGDLGYMDKDGFVYFKQRLKRLIVSSGYCIYPQYNCAYYYISRNNCNYF